MSPLARIWTMRDSIRTVTEEDVRELDASEVIAIGRSEAADFADRINDRIGDDLDDIYERVAEWYREAVDALESEDVAITGIELPCLDLVIPLKNSISYTELEAFWRDGGMSVRLRESVNSFDRAAFARRAGAANRAINDFYRSRLLDDTQLVSAHNGQHYTRACAAQATVRKESEALLENADAVIMSTVPKFAPKLEHVLQPEFDYDGLESASGYGRYTKIANVIGLPAITVPNEVESGPAVGLQLIGSRFDERTLLATHRVFETVSDDG